MTQVIDVTPTWSGVIRLLIAGVENGSESAREEIIRLARQYDAACDEIAELEAALEGMIEMATHHAMEPEERRDILNNARAAIAEAKGE